MLRYILLFNCALYVSCNLDYLNPTELQTKTSITTQEKTVKDLLAAYFSQYKNKYPDQWYNNHVHENVDIVIDRQLFIDNKDSFVIVASDNKLKIRASTGVAALWGYHYYVKKYCKGHFGWQVQSMSCPDKLPDAGETVIANDRFRYYQNVCTASYSFVWWKPADWTMHVLWMAFNGINLVLAPVAQEAAWKRVYERVGMTKEEIDEHFTGPAFLSWLRMGNVRGWGGPLYDSWHATQEANQVSTTELMLNLGMVPILPSFAGHVPTAFAKIYPNVTFHEVSKWNGFKNEYCCGIFLDPNEPLFKTIGTMFLAEVTDISEGSHIYTADPFNEIGLKKGVWSKAFMENTSRAIFSTMTRNDEKAVWLLQNWMFVHDSLLWPIENVKAFLTSVPEGRMLILDLQSEQWPQYDVYEMYFGQPFIWCMLHNFGGTLGMFGSMETINTAVYEVRNRVNSTMIGIGLTPEGINQNYVVYDLMLESAWRKGPTDLNNWVGEYAERRYGCNKTTEGWKYLLKSVYNFTGYNKMRGKYVVTRTPSFWLKPWAWYSSKDLFKAFKIFAFSDCSGPGFEHDLVDITRQALQYRAEQLYMQMLVDKNSNDVVFEASVNHFLGAMIDIVAILRENGDFSAQNWLIKARDIGVNEEEKYMYELNARNQITLWGPNGEISDYACKQWVELFQYYYIPRWQAFLQVALNASKSKTFFDQKGAQTMIRNTVEQEFFYEVIPTDYNMKYGVSTTARRLYKKWAIMPNFVDLPNYVITDKHLSNVRERNSLHNWHPHVTLMTSTTPY